MNTEVWEFRVPGRGLAGAEACPAVPVQVPDDEHSEGNSSSRSEWGLTFLSGLASVAEAGLTSM